MRAPSQVDTIAIGEMKFVSEIGLNQHGCSHKRETPRDKLVASRFQRPAGVATSVRPHETSSWQLVFRVAASVRLHETSSWHLDFSDAGVAASVRPHETSSWHLDFSDPPE